MTTADEICKTCGNSWAWHETHQPLHPFNDGQAGAQAFLGDKRRRRDRDDRDGAKTAPQSAQASPWPFDPVLRQALMDAGVITPDMLRNAEDKIRAVTGQFEEAVKESRR